MRILLTVHHELVRDSGAPGATLELSDALVTLGHEVSLYSWDQLPRWLSARARELLFPGFLCAHLLGLRRGLRPDVVDAMTGDGWLWAALRRSGSPLLVTRAHGLEHRFYAQEVEDARVGGRALGLLTRLYHGHLRLWQVARSLRGADLCLFLNASDRAYAIDELNVEPARAYTVQNGIPETLIGQGALLPPPDGAVSIAVVGSWTTRKGVHYGVPALNKLLAQHTELTVLLLGTAAATDTVLAQFDAAVRRRVEVVPSYARSELAGLLSASHINLFPTLAEGQSLALLETMACGLVPVTTPAGGGGVVCDGVNGLLVSPRDVGALITAVERLLGDRGLLERLRKSALQTADARSWTQAAQQLVALYEEGLGLTARA